MKMILNIDPIKSGIASIGSAMTGTYINIITLTEANTAFQHAAWTIAILAGLVSIVNGIITICNKIKDALNKKNKPKEELNET
jgi:L-serine deaminase